VFPTFLVNLAADKRMGKNAENYLKEQKINWLTCCVLFLFVALVAGLFIPKLGLYGDQWRIVLDPSFIMSGYPVGKLISILLVKLIGTSAIFFHLINAILMVVVGLFLFRILTNLGFKSSYALASTLLFLVFPGFGQPGAAFELSVLLIGLVFSMLSIEYYLLSQKMETKTELRYFIPGIVFSILAFITSPVIAIFEGLAILGLFLYFWFGRNIQPIWLVIFGAGNLISSLVVLTLFSHLPDNISMSSFTASIKTWIDVYLISWRKVVAMPSGGGIVAVYLLVIAITAGSLFLVFHKLQKKNEYDKTVSSRDLWIIVGTAFSGIILFIILGIFQIPIGMEYPKDLGLIIIGISAAIFMVTLIKTLFLENYQLVILALLIALSGGTRFLTTQRFVDETNQVKNLISQLKVRSDSLQPGTSLIVEQLPLDYTSRLSLEALIRNRMNLPQSGETVQVIPAENEDVREFLSNSEVESKSLRIDDFDYVVDKNKMLAIWQPKNECLFFLEPEMTYSELPEGLGLSGKYSNPVFIGINHMSDVKQLNQFRTTINPEWCFDYQLANRQEQNGQWENAITSYRQITDGTIKKERLAVLKPLLVSYLHSQRFSEARQISEELSVDLENKKIVCQQWTTYVKEKDISKEVLTEAQKAQISAGCN
jgi:hypothetical protein